MRRRTAPIIAFTAAALFIGVAAWAAQSAKVDLTGTWAFTVQSDAGTSTPTVILKQDGQKLTGRYSSMLVGEADLAGSIKDRTFEFTVRAEVQGFQLALKFEGAVEGTDSLKGTVSTELGGGTFTGKRK
jgi:hypothetical protein